MKTSENKVSDLQSKIRLLEKDLKTIIDSLYAHRIGTDQNLPGINARSKDLIFDLKKLSDNHTNQTIMKNIDLLETPELLPNSVLDILEKFSDSDYSYSECERLKSELNQLGYDIDYDLSGEPFNLIKL